MHDDFDDSAFGADDLPREGDFDAVLRGLPVVRVMHCKFCDTPIHFKDRVAYEDNGHEHRCITSHASKYSCFGCHAPITFTNRKPTNADGSPHRCIRPSASRAEPKRNVDPDTGEIFNQGSLL